MYKYMHQMTTLAELAKIYLIFKIRAKVNKTFSLLQKHDWSSKLAFLRF